MGVDGRVYPALPRSVLLMSAYLLTSEGWGLDSESGSDFHPDSGSALAHQARGSASGSDSVRDCLPGSALAKDSASASSLGLLLPFPSPLALWYFPCS